MRRLRAEEVRDSILAASGNLNVKKMYGPSIYPSIPKEVLAGQSQPGVGWGKSSPEEAARRSIYIHIKRSLAVPILTAFDVPDTDSGCAVRFTTTQPTQALGMLNGEFLNEQATLFAESVKRKGGERWRTRCGRRWSGCFSGGRMRGKLSEGCASWRGCKGSMDLAADESLPEVLFAGVELERVYVFGLTTRSEAPPGEAHCREAPASLKCQRS